MGTSLKPSNPPRRALCMDYRGDDPAKYIGSALEPLSKLKNILTVYVLIRPQPRHDPATLISREAAWRTGIEQWQARRKPPFTVNLLFDADSTLGGPCDDWWKNLVRAFRDPRIDRVVYLPVDIINLTPSLADALPRVQELVDSEADLAMGNCATVTLPDEARSAAVHDAFLVACSSAGRDARYDIRKNFLEIGIINELWAFFPSCMKRYCELREDAKAMPHPRTGFFGLGRALFEEFVRDRISMAPYEGTVQLLLAALIQKPGRSRQFTVAEHPLGEHTQTPESFGAWQFAHQLARGRFLVLNEHAYWSRVPGVEL